MRPVNYPRIIQIIPCENIWIEHKTKDDHWAEKAVALALIEKRDRQTGGIHTFTCYIGLHDVNESNTQGVLLHNYHYIYSVTKPVFQE